MKVVPMLLRVAAANAQAKTDAPSPSRWELVLAGAGTWLVAAFVFRFGVRSEKWLYPNRQWPERTWQVWRWCLALGFAFFGALMLYLAATS